MERQDISAIEAREMLATGEGVIVNAVALEQLFAERDQFRAEVERLRGVVNDLGEMLGDVRKQRDAATVRAEAAESLVAGLRGALNEVDEALCGITGLGNMAKQVAVAYTAINAALALTPASAGARIKVEAEKEAAHDR